LVIAVMTYNQEMLPAMFLANLISSTAKTPMPISAEIIFLIVMFELLKEASTRLPKMVGSAVTIVGALIIGDAAVNAGIVSAPSVIMVALTAVTGFMAPDLTEFILIYKTVFILLGSTLGMIGISIAYVVMMTQLCSHKAFGVPIMSIFTNLNAEDMKDNLWRSPLREMRYRPEAIAKDNVRRRG